jgi:hypothetical protein
MKEFESLSDENKLIYYLGLSQKIISTFSQIADRRIAQEAINRCWDWLLNPSNIGEELYFLLDDEDTGITVIEEMTANEYDKSAWNCIIDAIAFTSRKAYEREGANYFPEPIALVDDDLVTHFNICYIFCNQGDSGGIEKMLDLITIQNQNIGFIREFFCNPY